MNYVISKARPVSTVDDTAFMAMVIGLNPKASVMGAKKLRKMIENERKVFEEEVTAAMSSVANVCLTADMWSTTHRSWIGMTAHWLDEKTLARKSAALCCKRIKGQKLNVIIEKCPKLTFYKTGSHTHDLISGLIEEQVNQFKIGGKVVCIVTDNGANIRKAVRSMQDCAQERENARRLESMEAAKAKRQEKAGNNSGKSKAKKVKQSTIESEYCIKAPKYYMP